MKRILCILLAVASLSSFQISAQDNGAKKKENKTTYSSIYDMLRGQPGLIVGPGDEPTVIIRGIGTNTEAIQPLFVVDEIQTDKISYLRPEDVYRINIIKDGTAAMYGMQGANGVIEITTISKHESDIFAREAARKAVKGQIYSVRALDNDQYTISAGHVVMTVQADKGGRITSFKYDDKEVISQLPMFNANGSTFWTSPQAEWNWPPVAEIDRMPYEAKVDGTSLILTSQVSSRHPYRVTKEISADGNAIAVKYSITNEWGETRKVAPWEISRVLAGGVIFFDAPLSEITPASLLPMQEAYGVSWYAFEENPQNRKINADGKGWVAYANDGLLLVKKFDDLKSGEPAPGEAEIQVYVNMGNTFIEMESQGAYKTLAPGESLSWTVRWYLTPHKGEAVPSQQLVKAVKKVLSSR